MMKKKDKFNTTSACIFIFMCIAYHLLITHVYNLKKPKSNLKFRTDSIFTSQFLSNPKSPIKCHRTNKFYDLCLINARTTLDPSHSTFYVSGGDDVVETIRPYPRKWEMGTMRGIKEITISTAHSPQCDVVHNSPAMLFSAGGYVKVGGYAGNFFHEFNDGMVPLFVTIRSIFLESQDFVIVVADARDTWINKFSDLLSAYTARPIINLDKENATHCFSSAAIGLITHGFMTIKPRLMPGEETVFDLRRLFEKAYGGGPLMPRGEEKRPRLVLTKRTGSVGRVLLNHNEVKRLAGEIGFEVSEFQPNAKTRLRDCYALVNSSHAVVGVHGAALTHTVFLRPGAVFLQVVPLGVDIGAEIFFGDYARAIGLDYMEYKIRVGESSLSERFEKDSQVLTDPIAYLEEHRSVATNDLFFKEQDVKLDLLRFEKYLKTAYEKAKRFMEKEG